MANRTHKDVDWRVADGYGSVPTWERVQVAVLMDIRDELKRLNGIFQCHNFLAVPGILRDIQKNTTKPARRKRAK